MGHAVSLIEACCPKLDLIIYDQQPDAPLKDSQPKDVGHKWIQMSLQDQDTAIALWCGIACGQRLLPVPMTQDHMQLVLKRLEGRQHQIIMMIGRKVSNKVHLKTVVSRAKFKRLSDLERKDLLNDQSLWQGKVGGCIGAPQQLRYITALNGDPGALIGYSPYMLHNLMNTF